MPGFRWESGDYSLTRLLYLRSLGMLYLIGFLCALNQFRPLLGEHGLLPVPLFIKVAPFRETPSLFFFTPKDWAFASAAWLGIALSLLVVLGIAGRFGSWIHAAVWFVIWLLYLSFVNVGQTFYAFGWESIMLEAAFFAMFLGGREVRPPVAVIYLLRWLEFRIMFGAGMIKLHGDSCWRDLTCLDYHYETQPMPNPLSWYFHIAPEWTHKTGVAFNHFSELAVPFLYFLPQPVASIGGVLTIIFQLTIFASGNLSWLNFLTMILAIPAIDGRYLAKLCRLPLPELLPPGRAYRAAIIALAILVGWMSIGPIANLFSSQQIMNTDFNPLHLVGTYGAFGGITRNRLEVVVEGTSDAAETPSTRWLEYQFKGKPNDITRLPPQVAPYHLRLDWLMWFAAMSSYEEHPWFLNFMAKLLQNDRPVLGLLRQNPFPDAPPKLVRAELYEYRFASREEHRDTGQWWTRRPVAHYFPPVSLETPAFRRILEQEGWLTR